ncbi:MAG TPA: hypothetical protein VMT56_03915, partial [Candidatus Bathyarchaeia archaeon]|nr:hypothetical protein [Candidatus Bathyarchaeia archaeon]
MKLKATLFAVVLAVLFVSFSELQGQTTAPAPARKKRVAVFDFDYATVQTASAAAFGTNVDVGRGISDLTVKYLVQDGTY